MTKVSVKEAHTLLRNGDFEQAKALYQQLNKLLGSQVFNINIQLCELKRNVSADQFAMDRIGMTETQYLKDPIAELQSQLRQVQQDLEHYYALSQNLQLRLKRQ